ncbi:serine/threonine protein kinase [Micromonospora endolithica]|uniref:non-specific serine/threonine protein kinase n=2 Tax=Micromonospora endolithica TaxID=230091 RepID=A0A3A9ZTJ6_9ACTN|nr:serine/threonine protein kinase [Micromonospora endolithica]
MGRVWLARDEMLHRDVAVKEIVPPTWLAESERAEVRLRTLREARTAARLAHPNVVRVYDVVHDRGSPWIVMEYVPSRSVQQILGTEGPLEPRRAARIGLAVLAALRAAHAAGVLHRDVKPHNVLVADDGRVVLTDFGLATFVSGDGGMTGPGLVLGSPQYVAPERARDGVSDTRTDLWSLGATLYAAVEGQSPYARVNMMATLSALASEDPTPARRAGPLRPVLDGLLQRDPARRLTAAEAEPLLLVAAADHDRPVGPDRPAGSTGRAPAAGLPAWAGPGEQSTRPNRPVPDRPVPDRPVPNRPVPDRLPGDGEPDRSGVGSGTAPTDRAASPGTPLGTSGPVPDRLARPADPASARRRRRRWIGAGTATALFVAAGIGVALSRPDDPKTPAPGSGAGSPAPRPAAFACATPPPSDATPVPSVPPPPGAFAVVPNWTWHQDPAGWRIAAPVGWLRWTDGTATCFRERGGARVLSVESGPRRADPVGWWQAEEQRLTADGSGLRQYRKVDITPLDMFAGGALWECAWTNAVGERVQTARLLANTSADRSYTVSWLTREFDWGINREFFLMIRQSFTPLP